MRYDRILRALDAAREKYESTIRAIIAGAAKQDGSTETVIRKLVKKTRVEKPRKQYKRKGLHWTQKPENQARVKAQLKKAKKVAQAKKRAIKRANAEHDNG